MGVPVIHMEAGNRCFDLDVPEEKNRKVIDAISTVNMPYTEQSKKHLVSEGVPSRRIVLTGNPIYEVMQHYDAQVSSSKILKKLKLKSGQYFLVTAHRAENVDHAPHLLEIMKGLNQVAEEHGLRVICSIPSAYRDPDCGASATGDEPAGGVSRAVWILRLCNA